MIAKLWNNTLQNLVPNLNVHTTVVHQTNVWNQSHVKRRARFVLILSDKITSHGIFQSVVSIALSVHQQYCINPLELFQPLKSKIRSAETHFPSILQTNVFTLSISLQQPVVFGYLCINSSISHSNIATGPRHSAQDGGVVMLHSNGLNWSFVSKRLTHNIIVTSIG
jgi:hypothetical protein